MLKFKNIHNPMDEIAGFISKKMAHKSLFNTDYNTIAL